MNDFTETVATAANDSTITTRADAEGGMSEEFRKCLKLERDRARSRRESAQGSFESAMLSLDQHVESFDDPGKIAMFSDGGAEAERVYSYDESVDGSYYTRRIKAARRRLSRNCPELVEVFNLVVKNGKNRHESIAELALRHHVENEVAKMRYWGHLKKISFFFKAQ